MIPFTFFFPVHLADGYGRSGMFALHGLKEIGHPVRPINVINYREPNLTSSQILDLVDTAGPTTWHLLHAVPDALPYFNFPKRVIWTMWEGVTIPRSWVKALNDAGCPVIVPGEAIADAFRDSGVKARIYTVPLAVDTETFTFSKISNRMAPINDKNPFTVIHWSSMIDRKYPLEMVDVFQRAFPNDPNVRLVLKTRPSQFVRALTPRVADPRVVVINEDWPSTRVADWVRRAHAGLFLSHGEGWYLEPLEATLTGLPCVVPTHSGCSAWAHGDLFYTVPTLGVDRWPNNPYGDDQRWYVQDLDAAVDQLRAIYENYDGALVKAKEAAEYVRVRYKPEMTARLLAATMETIDADH